MRGITRATDRLGRVTIPKQYRDALEISNKELLEISLSGKEMILRKAEDECLICGSIEKVVIFENIFICKSCISKIKSI